MKTKHTLTAFGLLLAAATAQTPWTPEPFYVQPNVSPLRFISMEPYRIQTGGIRPLVVQPVNSRPLAPVLPRR
jgi:hypothetical protein